MQILDSLRIVWQYFIIILPLRIVMWCSLVNTFRNLFIVHKSNTNCLFLSLVYSTYKMKLKMKISKLMNRCSKPISFESTIISSQLFIATPIYCNVTRHNFLTSASRKNGYATIDTHIKTKQLIDEIIQFQCCPCMNICI